ncbi:MAG TPA: PIN domain-containing protein [Acidimicrobiales bacterium]|nr:PIN domain-containing protein [Acidimicrobiales bacterium]
MTILDAHAVLAFLKNEPAADEVEQLLLTGGVLTAVGVVEVIDHLVRIAGGDEEEASLDLAQLGLDDAVVLDSVVASAAGRLRARHYHRTRCPISLADCVAAEVARSTGRSLATSDPALLDVCHHEQIPLTVLPRTDGSRWSPPRPV